MDKITEQEQKNGHNPLQTAATYPKTKILNY